MGRKRKNSVSNETIVSFKSNGSIKTPISTIKAGDGVSVERKKDTTGQYELDEVTISSTGSSGANLDVVSNPLPVTGNLVINSGLIDIDFGKELEGLSKLNQLGFVVRESEGVYNCRALSAGDNISIEYPDGIGGDPVISAAPSEVVEIGLHSRTNGLQVFGSPVMGSGTIDLSLNDTLQKLSEISDGVGLISRNLSGDYTPRPLKAGEGIKITSPDGEQGDILISTTSTSGGTVTSVGLEAIGEGINITGSPITTNGTITLQLKDELQKLSGLSSFGIIARDNSGQYAFRELEAGDNITITNGSGETGNPVISASGGGGGSSIRELYGAITTGIIDPNIEFVKTVFNSHQQITSAGILWDFKTNGVRENTIGYNISGSNDDWTLAAKKLQTYVSRNFYEGGDTSKQSLIRLQSETSIHNEGSVSMSLDHIRSGYPTQNIFTLSARQFPDYFRTTINLNADVRLSGSLELLTGTIRGVPIPVAPDNVANKEYVDIKSLPDIPNNELLYLNGKSEWTNPNTQYFSNSEYPDKFLTYDFKIRGLSVVQDLGGLNLKHTIDSKTGTKTPVKINLYTSENSTLDIDIKSDKNLNFISKQDIMISAWAQDKMLFENSDDIRLIGNTKLRCDAAPTTSSHLTNRNYVDTKVNENSLYGGSINVNRAWTDKNWLRLSAYTRTNVQVYGLDGYSFIVENQNGESAGMGFSGNTDAATVWTAGDSNSLFNVQDEDSSNSRRAYVDSSGYWNNVSSRTNKHSIRTKANNDVLDRLMKLSVKSYGYKYDKRKDSTDKRNKRVERKTNKMCIGLILEELFEVFPNCVSDYYNKLGQDKKTVPLDIKKEIKDIKNSGINYNTLFCYLLMGFQELVKEVRGNNE